MGPVWPRGGVRLPRHHNIEDRHAVSNLDVGSQNWKANLL